MRYLFILLALLFTGSVHAQYMINTRLDKTSAFIGDPIRLTVLAVGPSNTHIKLPLIDSIPFFEIIQTGKIDSAITTNNKRVEQEYTIVSFDTGLHQIPVYTFIVNDQKMFSEPIEVQITFVPTDVSGEFKDIHSIEAVPPPPSMFWWWVSGIIVLIALIVFLLNKLKKNKDQKPTIQSTSSFDDILKQLQALREVKEPNAGDYQVLINILRTYLSQKEGFPSTGQTYQHLYKFTQNLRLKLNHIKDLKTTLDNASVSVFALKKQTNEHWQNDINHISNIILQLNANKA